MCDKSKKNMIENFGSLEKMTNYFSLFSKRFGITSDIINNNAKWCRFKYFSFISWC